MSQPLTILHAHSGNLYGGVETMLGTLARHPGPLVHRFALCYEGRLAGELRGAGAQVGMLGPVSTIVMSLWLLDEPMGPAQIAGTVLVLIGVLLVTRLRR